MLHHSRVWVSLALITIVVLLSLPVVSAQDVKPEAVGLRPDAPQYALHGPYWVGMREFVIEDAERPLPLIVWYPALNPERKEEAIIYTVDHGSESPPATIAGRAVADATPDLSSGPYPLLVYSPGGGAMAQHGAYLPEHLASQGFVVIAAAHPGNTTPDLIQSFLSEEGTAAYLKGDALAIGLRPLDVQREITYAETLTTNGSGLAGMIDMEKIAVMGPSYGGYTALAAAGARINFGAFKTWCTGNVRLCTVQEMSHVVQYEAEIASIIGVEAGVDGLWPSLSDPRIDAAVSLSPGSTALFDAEGLKGIGIPTLLLVGSADQYETKEPVDFVYEKISSQIKAEIVFNNAGHMIANFSCAESPDYVAIGFSSYCSDPVWDMYRLHDLTNHFTTAFLLDVLKGDKDAHAALAPDAVSFTGIEYQAEGY